MAKKEEKARKSEKKTKSSTTKFSEDIDSSLGWNFEDPGSSSLGKSSIDSPW